MPLVHLVFSIDDRVLSSFFGEDSSEDGEDRPSGGVLKSSPESLSEESERCTTRESAGEGMEENLGREQGDL